MSVGGQGSVVPFDPSVLQQLTPMQQSLLSSFSGDQAPQIVGKGGAGEVVPADPTVQAQQLAAVALANDPRGVPRELVGGPAMREALGLAGPTYGHIKRGRPVMGAVAPIEGLGGGGTGTQSGGVTKSYEDYINDFIAMQTGAFTTALQPMIDAQTSAMQGYMAPLAQQTQYGFENLGNLINEGNAIQQGIVSGLSSGFGGLESGLNQAVADMANLSSQDRAAIEAAIAGQTDQLSGDSAALAEALFGMDKSMQGYLAPLAEQSRYGFENLGNLINEGNAIQQGIVSGLGEGFGGLSTQLGGGFSGLESGLNQAVANMANLSSQDRAAIEAAIAKQTGQLSGDSAALAEALFGMDNAISGWGENLASQVNNLPSEFVAAYDPYQAAWQTSLQNQLAGIQNEFGALQGSLDPYLQSVDSLLAGMQASPVPGAQAVPIESIPTIIPNVTQSFGIGSWAVPNAYHAVYNPTGTGQYAESVYTPPSAGAYGFGGPGSGGSGSYLSFLGEESHGAGG